MDDLLTSTEMVRSPLLTFERLCLAGVRLGDPAHQIPRHRIVDVTFSPIVRGYRGGTGVKPQFLDGAGRELALSEVVDSVIHSDGCVHISGDASFRISGGHVAGFTLYGDPLRRRFAHLRSHADFLLAFGVPDRMAGEEVYGDLFAFDHYYFALRKYARWSMDSATVECVNWCVYDVDGPTADRGVGPKRSS